MKIRRFRISEEDAEELAAAVMKIRRLILELTKKAVEQYELDVFEGTVMHLKLVLSVVEQLTGITLEDEKRLMEIMMKRKGR